MASTQDEGQLAEVGQERRGVNADIPGAQSVSSTKPAGDVNDDGDRAVTIATELPVTVCVDIIPDCAICLQLCIYPVQLPCSHIFCFLCIKGVAIQSKRCALCRQEIPIEFLDAPRLVQQREPIAVPEHADADDDSSSGAVVCHRWYYEGRNGWWQYDERTSRELEEAYTQSKPYLELLIAGFLYIIDLNSMLQMRRHDPNRRRRVKRDSDTLTKKGVAGIRADALKHIRTGQEVQLSLLVDKAGQGGASDPSNKGGVRQKTSKSLFARKSPASAGPEGDQSSQPDGGDGGSKLKLSKIPALFGFGSKQKSSLKREPSRPQGDDASSAPEDGATANLTDQLADLRVGERSPDRTQSDHDPDQN